MLLISQLICSVSCCGMHFGSVLWIINLYKLKSGRQCLFQSARRVRTCWIRWVCFSSFSHNVNVFLSLPICKTFKVLKCIWMNSLFFSGNSLYFQTDFLDFLSLDMDMNLMWNMNSEGEKYELCENHKSVSEEFTL